jgi:hypothetical protein
MSDMAERFAAYDRAEAKFIAMNPVESINIVLADIVGLIAALDTLGAATIPDSCAGIRKLLDKIEKGFHQSREVRVQ